jgi:uncharacterized protein with PQ loop repeat
MNNLYINPLVYKIVEWDGQCTQESTITYVIGVFLCIGGIVSYLPQYLALLNSKEEPVISELSLLFLNIGSASLACNSLILNFYQFKCYKECSFWICSGNLLPFFQICIGWIIVFPLYLIYVRVVYKFRETAKKSYKNCMYEMSYVITYAIFLIVVILLLAIEDYTYKNVNVFNIIAYILGIISMVCWSIVWIPQIVILIREKNDQGLSLPMFLIQTPGNALIIIFQAILNHQNWSTWIAYLFNLIEQLIIVVILIVLKCIKRNERKKKEIEKHAEELENVSVSLLEDGLYEN